MADVEKSINIIIEDLELELVSVINKYHLPIKISELALRDVLSNISHTAKDILLNERSEYNTKLREEENQTNDKSN